MTTLYLSGNELTQLPPEIGKLTKLTWLDLRVNPIPIAEIAKIKHLLPRCVIKF
ncbi:MAG: hypothetical protein ACK4NS_03615 [Saprospiraceae bacterium]